MRREDRDDIERNKIHIRTMANLLHSILQVPKSLSSSADPVETPHTPPPAVGDICDPFVTTKRPVRHAFSDIKNEEGEENDDGGGETYGDLASSYLKHFLSPRRHVVENHYGIRRYGDNFMIGDSIISVDRRVI